MKLKNIFATFAVTFVSASLSAAPQLKVQHLACEQNIVAVSEAPRFLLLPVQDDAPEAKVGIISGGTQVGVLANVRLARVRIDYYVPYSLEGFVGKDVKIDV